MVDSYDIVYSVDLKSDKDNERVKENVAEHNASMSDGPQYKIVIPQYMFKPAWGFPRHQALGLLRSLGKNVYASSVFKTIKDLIVDTPWDIVLKEGVEMTDELEKKQAKYKLFFQRPNPEESYSTFVRKVLDDTFKYDSGIINKVFNQFEELIQMRAAPGDTFKKNPNRHGYLDERDELILNKALSENQRSQLIQSSNAVNNGNVDGFANTAAFQFYTNFIDRAAYFQFVNAVASQIPIPFGKREICWLTTNPSTDNIYTNGAPLEDAIDIVLTLVYGSKYNLDFYANGNTPEGIINAVGATKKDLKRIKEQLGHSMNSPRDAFGLKRRVGYRMPVTSLDNLEFVKLNLTSAEMEILNQQQWFTKILWMRFGLNADEMGFTEDSNRATGVQQDKNAKRKAIKPFFTMLEECFTHDILTEFEDGDLFRFQYDFHDVNEEKVLRELQNLKIQMGIESPQNIMEDEGIDAEKIKAHKMEDVEFSFGEEKMMASIDGEGNGDKKGFGSSDKQDKALNKEKEKPETKSFTAGIGGEGTTDSVMNPVSTSKKKLVGKGGHWTLSDLDGSNSTSFKSRDEALEHLKAVHKSNDKAEKKNKAEGYKGKFDDNAPTDDEEDAGVEEKKKKKSEVKGHAGTELVISEVEGHIHIVNENDKVSSVDDNHQHKVDWQKMILEPAGVNNHTHTITEPTELKGDEPKDNLTDKEQKELVLESPIEKVMKTFMKKLDKKNKEIVKKAGD